MDSYCILLIPSSRAVSSVKIYSSLSPLLLLAIVKLAGDATI